MCRITIKHKSALHRTGSLHRCGLRFGHASRKRQLASYLEKYLQFNLITDESDVELCFFCFTPPRQPDNIVLTFTSTPLLKRVAGVVKPQSSNTSHTSYSSSHLYLRRTRPCPAFRVTSIHCSFFPFIYPISVSRLKIIYLMSEYYHKS